MSGRSIFFIGENRVLPQGLARQFEKRGYPVRYLAEPDTRLFKSQGLLLADCRLFNGRHGKALAAQNGGRLFKVALLHKDETEKGLELLRQNVIQETLDLPLNKNQIKLLLAKWQVRQALYQRLASLKRHLKQNGRPAVTPGDNERTRLQKRELFIRYLYRTPVRRILEVKLDKLIEQACREENGVALYPQVLAQVEGPLLLTVLEKVGGNQAKAAKILGLNRNTLHHKIQQFKLR